MMLLERYQWWVKGECTVEVVKAGHFPTTVTVKLPNGAETEVDVTELDNGRI